MPIIKYYSDWNLLKKKNIFQRIAFILFPNKFLDYITTTKEVPLEVLESTKGVITFTYGGIDDPEYPKDVKITAP